MDTIIELHPGSSYLQALPPFPGLVACLCQGMGQCCVVWLIELTVNLGLCSQAHY